jgi:peptide/nickel transport system permease protein
MNEMKKRLVSEQRRITLHKFFSNRLSVIGGAIVLCILIIAFFAPFIAPKDAYAVDVVARYKAPSSAHLFGTDELGRDVFTRVIYGTRISMTVGFSVGIISGILGMIMGLYACTSKILDSILMRFCDGMKAIPGILMAIMLMTVLGADIKNVIISLVIVNTPNMARLARSSALVAREQTYVEAMRALGARPARILWNHIAVNIVSPVIVQMTFVFASAIITEAGLSFLGAGVPVPIPSWGSILNEGKQGIYVAWWLVVFPGFFTAITVLGLNLFGDGLRDMLDPLSN